MGTVFWLRNIPLYKKHVTPILENKVSLIGMFIFTVPTVPFISILLNIEINIGNKIGNEIGNGF